MTCTNCKKNIQSGTTRKVYMNREAVIKGECLCDKCLDERKALINSDNQYAKRFPKSIPETDQEEQTHAYGHNGTTLREIPLKKSLKPNL
jgi:hypothetical protein